MVNGNGKIIVFQLNVACDISHWEHLAIITFDWNAGVSSNDNFM